MTTAILNHFNTLSNKNSKLTTLSQETATELKLSNSTIKVVDDTLPQLIQSLIPQHEAEDTPFYILNVATVVEKFKQWKNLLPRVEPHYAVKCNPDDVILNTLAGLGAGFDCASQGEIDKVLKLGNVAPEEIIFANPCKPVGHLNFAKRMGVKQMTFDNLQELQKIRVHYPEAELFLRIVVDDSGALCQFSSKFGAPLNECGKLFKAGKEMGLNIVGISFHVGSGQQTVEAYADALDRAKMLFDLAKEEGIELKVLDIGGGFPGDELEDDPLDFESFAKSIAQKIDELFPNTRCIAEPGRYFAAACATLVTKVTSVRDQTDCDTVSKYLYYINDGVYGSFNNILFDHATCYPKYLKKVSEDYEHVSTIFGPSCDGLDCILKNYPLPKIEMGEWLYWRNMGAYTMCAAASFNGFPLPEIHYYWLTNNTKN